MQTKNTLGSYLDELAGQHVRIDLANGGGSESGELVVHTDYVTFKGRTVVIAIAQIARVEQLPDETALAILREARFKVDPGGRTSESRAALIRLRDAVLAKVEKAGWSVNTDTISNAGPGRANVRLREEDERLQVVTDWLSSKSPQVRSDDKAIVEDIHFAPASGEYVGENGIAAVVVVATIVAAALNGETVKPSAK
jgi:hypothetical protein